MHKDKGFMVINAPVICDHDPHRLRRGVGDSCIKVGAITFLWPRQYLQGDVLLRRAGERA